MSVTSRPSSPPPQDDRDDGMVTDSQPPTSETPSRGSRRLRKEEIVMEATRLFAERGYEGASMGDLAERVGLRKASLFHHFPSKDVLYATVLHRLLMDVQQAIQTALLSEGSFEARLDAMNDAITAALGASPNAARLLLREGMDWGPVMRGPTGEALLAILAAGLELAQAGQREGAFNPDIDALQALLSIVGIHLVPFSVGEIIQRFTGQSPFDEQRIEVRRREVREQVRLMVLARK